MRSPVISDERQECIHPLVAGAGLMMDKRPEEKLIGCIGRLLPFIEGKDPVEPPLAVRENRPEKRVGAVLIIQSGLGIERQEDEAGLRVSEPVFHGTIEGEYSPIGAIFVTPVEDRKEIRVFLILLVDRGIQGGESGSLGCELPKGIDDVRFRGIFILKVKRSYSAYMVREFKDRAQRVECVFITVRFIRDQRVGIDLSGGCMQRKQDRYKYEEAYGAKTPLGDHHTTIPGLILSP
jgi:hypothetical protein